MINIDNIERDILDWSKKESRTFTDENRNLKDIG